jgi:hypothetical protein
MCLQAEKQYFKLLGPFLLLCILYALVAKFMYEFRMICARLLLPVHNHHVIYCEIGGKRQNIDICMYPCGHVSTSEFLYKILSITYSHVLDQDYFLLSLDNEPNLLHPHMIVLASLVFSSIFSPTI